MKIRKMITTGLGIVLITTPSVFASEGVVNTIIINNGIPNENQTQTIIEKNGKIINNTKTKEEENKNKISVINTIMFLALVVLGYILYTNQLQKWNGLKKKKHQ